MRNSTFARYVFIILFGFFACNLTYNSVMFAGEGETTTASAPAEDDGVDLPKGWFALVTRGGGAIGWVILLLSVVALGLCIENLVSLKREKLMPDDVLGDIEGALDNGEYEEALDICQSEDCMMTRILGAGLSKMANGFERMEEAMAEEADAQATLLHQKLGYINLIAGTAPMLGLFGTVSGMIGAFEMIATKEAPNPKQLAGGIYVALVTTFLGLFVAIPATVAFTFFRGRVVKLLMVMGIITGEILDRFRPVEE